MNQTSILGMRAKVLPPCVYENPTGKLSQNRREGSLELKFTRTLASTEVRLPTTHRSEMI